MRTVKPGICVCHLITTNKCMYDVCAVQ